MLSVQVKSPNSHKVNTHEISVCPASQRGCLSRLPHLSSHRGEGAAIPRGQPSPPLPDPLPRRQWSGNELSGRDTTPADGQLPPAAGRGQLSGVVSGDAPGNGHHSVGCWEGGGLGCCCDAVVRIGDWVTLTVDFSKCFVQFNPLRAMEGGGVMVGDKWEYWSGLANVRMNSCGSTYPRGCPPVQPPDVPLGSLLMSPWAVS